jgi:hypothetical protein
VVFSFKIVERFPLIYGNACICVSDVAPIFSCPYRDGRISGHRGETSSLQCIHLCICVSDAISIVCTDVAISQVMLEDAHADLISNQGPENHVRCKKMTYEELYLATEGFKEDLKLGEGGFGPVYKGFLDSTNQVGSHTSVQAKVFCYVSLYKNQTSTVVVFLYLQPNLINAVVDL